MGLVQNAAVMVQVTLDRSQAGSLTAARQAFGFKAQNNTLAVYVNPYEIAKFAARLDYEHAVAAAQKQPVMAAAAPATPPRP